MNPVVEADCEAYARLMEELGDELGLPLIVSSSRYTARRDTRQWRDAIADLVHREADVVLRRTRVSKE